MPVYTQNFDLTANASPVESTEGFTVTTVGPVMYASATPGSASHTVVPYQLVTSPSSGLQISINNGAVVAGSNVISLVYHNHTMYQHAGLAGSFDDWWFSSTPLSPPGWVEFAIAGISLSATTYPAGTPANTTIATILVPMTVSTLTFNGTLIVSDSINFKIVGNTLVSNAILTAGPYNFTITATPTPSTVGNAFTSGTLSVSQVQVGQGAYPFLIGFEPGDQRPSGTAQAGLPAGVSYTGLVGMPPDLENDGSDGTYVGMDGTNANWQTQWKTDGFPVQFQTSHIADSNNPTSSPYTNPATAASGGYNSIYQQLINAVGNYAQYIYAIRIDWEWSGNWYPFSPFCTSNIGNGTYAAPWYSASTFIRGWRQMVDTLKADARWAHVKIQWDYPLSWNGVFQGSSIDPLTYYPATAGDTANGGAASDKTSYVDLIGNDPYFGIDGGANSNISWTNYLNGTYGLTSMANFAAARSKKLSFMEWGDGWTDGYCIDQFANWCKNTVPTLGTNVVLLSYFNGGNPGLPQGDVSLNNNSTRRQHYINNFGPAAMGTSYTGTYWTHLANTGTRPTGL